jgi:hypothetical protein
VDQQNPGVEHLYDRTLTQPRFFTTPLPILTADVPEGNLLRHAVSRGQFLLMRWWG